jgi:capsule polysaccharide export protein KpsE/RkpR
MIFFYLFLFLFVDEQFDSKSLIVPTEDNSFGGIASLLSDVKGNLPFGIGGNMNPEMSMYNTIIYSRTNIDSVISKFDLANVYSLDKKDPEYIEYARKEFLSNLDTKETEDGAYEITIRANSPELSSNINNYIINSLNQKLVDLKIRKSKENREFLGKRLEEVKQNLKNSEESLKDFQTETGLYEVEDQLKQIITAYVGLESDFMSKELQKNVLEKIYGGQSPQVKNIEIEVNEFKKKLDNLKNNQNPEGLILPLKGLPKIALAYVRLYRDVEINTKLLQFMLPLYEQAKLEEQKEMPVLQVVDYAIPPVKKSFPPRTIFTLLFGAMVAILLFTFIIIKEGIDNNNSERMSYIKENLFKWNVK